MIFINVIQFHIVSYFLFLENYIPELQFKENEIQYGGVRLTSHSSKQIKIIFINWVNNFDYSYEE